MSDINSMSTTAQGGGSSTTAPELVAIAYPASDLGPVASARIHSREVFAADPTVQGPIPPFHKNPRVWFDYFDDDKDGRLTKPQLLQALVDTYNMMFGSPPDVGRFMDTVDSLWEIAYLKEEDDLTISEFSKENGTWEALISSVMPASTPAPVPPPPQSVASTSAGTLVGTPAAHTAVREIIVVCGGCTTRLEVTVPAYASSFSVVCNACRKRNNVSISADQLAAPQAIARSSRPTYVDFGGANSYPISAATAFVPVSGSRAPFATSTWKAHAPEQVIVLGIDHVDLFAFAKACKFIGNFVTGFESKANQIGEERFNFGSRAIEVDSRLVWHLGQLAQKFDGRDVVYVYIKQSAEKYLEDNLLDITRCERLSTPSILQAFSNGVVMRSNPWTEDEKLDLLRYYHETIAANIAEFLKSRNHIIVRTDDDGSSFREFLLSICAECDRESCILEWKARSDIVGGVSVSTPSVAISGANHPGNNVSASDDFGGSLGGGATVTGR